MTCKEVRKYFEQAYGPMILKPDYREFVKSLMRRWGRLPNNSQVWKDDKPKNSP